MAQGATLHGFGPVNSSMAGAGVALPEDSLDALGFNPALLTAAEGNQLSFTTEFSWDDIQIDTTIGNLSGDAHPSRQVGVMPSFGWMVRDPRKKLALGFGLIGQARVQHRLSAGQRQPPLRTAAERVRPHLHGILGHEDPGGLRVPGQPEAAVGASLNVYVGPVRRRAAALRDVRHLREWRPLVSRGGQAEPEVRVHAAVRLLLPAQPQDGARRVADAPQNYAAYEWNSSIADPSSRAYGTARTLSYDLDGPMIVSFGIGLKMNPKTQIAIDGMFTKYRGVSGFGSAGGIVNGIIEPFGWRNVWTFKTGVQHQMSEKTHGAGRLQLQPDADS